MAATRTALHPPHHGSKYIEREEKMCVSACAVEMEMLMGKLNKMS